MVAGTLFLNNLYLDETRAQCQMKPLFIFFLSIATCIYLMGCQRDGATMDMQGTGGDDTPAKTFFLADIEGVSLNATDVSVSETTIQGVLYIEINAENASTSQLLRLVIPADVPVGSYPMMSHPSTDGIYGTYQPDRNIDSNIFVSTSGLFNLINKSSVPLRISGNTVFTMANEQGDVDEVTFCEFTLIYE